MKLAAQILVVIVVSWVIGATLAAVWFNELGTADGAHGHDIAVLQERVATLEAIATETAP